MIRPVPVEVWRVWVQLGPVEVQRVGVQLVEMWRVGWCDYS